MQYKCEFYLTKKKYIETLIYIEACMKKQYFLLDCNKLERNRYFQASAKFNSS